MDRAPHSERQCDRAAGRSAYEREPMARQTAAVAARSSATAEAKLVLLEALQRSANATAAAQSAADWLVAHTDAEKTVVAAPNSLRGTLGCVAGAGISSRQLQR